MGTERANQPSMPLADNNKVGQLSDVQIMSQRASRPCLLVQWMMVDRRDHWSTRSHSPLSAQRLRLFSEGKEMSIRSKSNYWRVFNVVMGRDCCAGVGSDETAAVRFRLCCGAVRLLNNARTNEGGNTYAAAGLRGLSCLSSATRFCVEGQWP